MFVTRVELAHLSLFWGHGDGVTGHVCREDTKVPEDEHAPKEEELMEPGQLDKACKTVRSKAVSLELDQEYLLLFLT